MDQKPPQIRHTMMSATRVAPARPVGRAAPVPAARAAEARTFSLTRETAVSYLWAVVRLGMAWTFLWPFFDKDVRTCAQWRAVRGSRRSGRLCKPTQSI